MAWGRAVRRRLVGSVGGALVGGTALQNEAPIAITTLDKAFFVDAEEHARVAQRGTDLTAAVAMNGIGGDGDDFRRRLHDPPGVATASRRFNKLWGAY